MKERVVKQCYVPKKFNEQHAWIIQWADRILTEMMEDGYVLTLRQLYYQFVARALIPESWADEEYNAARGLPPGTVNTDRSYKRLGGIITKARRAGLLDWDTMEDRTRNRSYQSAWTDPHGILETAYKMYHVDLWEGQEQRVEVWIEKDALVGVIHNVCRENDTPYFSCRGYTSDTEMRSAAERFIENFEVHGQETVILHLGDHDPSGIDMSRDICDRLRMFMEYHADHLTVKRIALTMDQIRQFNPPPNPAKLSDARANKYIARYGSSSWELDALDPHYMSQLIQDAVDEEKDATTWLARCSEQEEQREQLKMLHAKWPEVVSGLLAL